MCACVPSSLARPLVRSGGQFPPPSRRAAGSAQTAYRRRALGALRCAPNSTVLSQVTRAAGLIIGRQSCASLAKMLAGRPAARRLACSLERSIARQALQVRPAVISFCRRLQAAPLSPFSSLLRPAPPLFI